MAIMPRNEATTQRAEEERAKDRARAKVRRERLRTNTHCVVCNKKLTGAQRKYCSDECKPKKNGPSINYNKQCAEDGCDGPVLARGLCPTHYSKARRASPASHHTKTCTICGQQYTTPYVRSTTCSKACAASAGGRANASKIPAPALFGVGDARQCKHCGNEFIGRTNYCGDECRDSAVEKRARSQWSPMRRAFENRDGPAMIEAIGQYVTKTEDGCWEWGRKLRAEYPAVKIGSKSYQVHRLMLEAKIEAPLGSQAAHHICANSRCVNPDHLQPVTHRENIAEMLARQSYLARIAELEAALAEVNPGHPILKAIPVR